MFIDNTIVSSQYQLYHYILRQSVMWYWSSSYQS